MNNKSCPNIVTLNVDLFRTKERKKKNGLLTIGKKRETGSICSVVCNRSHVLRFMLSGEINPMNLRLCINLRRRKKINIKSLAYLCCCRLKEDLITCFSTLFIDLNSHTLPKPSHSPFTTVSCLYKFSNELLIGYQILFE